MINLNDLAREGALQNTYQEDTALEDRLALEAEEDKKIGSQYPDDTDYTFSRSSLTGRDATQVLWRITTIVCGCIIYLFFALLVYMYHLRTCRQNIISQRFSHSS